MPTYNFTVSKAVLDNNADGDYSGLLKDPATGNATGVPFSAFSEDAARMNVSCTVDTTGWENKRAQIVLLDKDSEIVTWETVWIDSAGEFDYRQMYEWNAGGTLEATLQKIAQETADMHGTDLPAVKAETALIYADTQAIRVTDLPAVKAETALIYTDTQALITDVAAVKAETALIYADTQQLLTDVAGVPASVWAEVLISTTTAGDILSDWADGQRLDAILDQILVNTAQPGNGDITYAVPDNISQPRTFTIVGSSSTSVPRFNTFTTGQVTLAIDMDNIKALNPDTTIAGSGLTIVSCVHRDSQVAQATANPLVQQNRRKANFDVVGPVTRIGNYDVVANIITSDGQSLNISGVFNVPS